MSVIIHATSGSGKSTFCKFAFGPCGIRVIDGDDVIAAANAWPKQDRWWKLPDAGMWHAKHAQIITRLLTRNRDAVVVFNGSVQQIHDSIKDMIKADLVQEYAVALPEPELLARAHARNEAFKKGGKPAAGGHSPRPLVHFLEGARHQRAVFERLNIVVMPSFESLAEALHLHVKPDYFKLAKPPVPRAVSLLLRTAPESEVQS